MGKEWTIQWYLMAIGKISKWKKIKPDAHLTPHSQINFILLKVLNVKKKKKEH